MKRGMMAMLLLLASAAQADTQTGRIVGFLPYSSGSREMIILKLENNVTGGCNVTGRFAIDNTSPHYKPTVAAILAAFHAQAEVTVAYTQTCNAWGNSWDVSYFCTGSANC